MLAATVSTSTPGACNQDPQPEATSSYRHEKKKKCNDSAKKTVSSEFTFKYSLPLDQRNVCSVCLTLLHCL